VRDSADLEHEWHDGHCAFCGADTRDGFIDQLCNDGSDDATIAILQRVDIAWRDLLDQHNPDWRSFPGAELATLNNLRQHAELPAIIRPRAKRKATR
jgi:hypothetical protein